MNFSIVGGVPFSSFLEVASTPGVARQLAVTTVSNNVVLTPGITRISICANGADMRFAVGNVAQVATIADAVPTSHILFNKERIELKISAYATPNIAAITATGSGTLEISEYL